MASTGTKATSSSSVTQHSNARDPVYLFRKTLEFEVPLLHWRYKANVSNVDLCCSPLMQLPTNPITQWKFFVRTTVSNHHYTKVVEIKFALMDDSNTDATTCAGVLKVLDKKGSVFQSSRPFSGVFKSNVILCQMDVSNDSLQNWIAQDKEKDNFILRCELEVLQSGIPYDKSSKHDELQNKSQHYLNNIWKSIGSDDVITIKTDACKLNAHRSILTARSPVFAAMFQYDTAEKLTNTIELNDIDEAALGLLLEFIYTNEISKDAWSEEKACKLLIAADKYLLPDLKEKCEDYLIPIVSPSNCNQLCKLAHQHCAKRLKRVVVCFLNSQLTDIVTKPKFWNALASPDCILSLSELVEQLYALVDSVSEDTKAEAI